MPSFYDGSMSLEEKSELFENLRYGGNRVMDILTALNV